MPHISKSQRQTIGAKIDVLLLKILDLSFRATYASGSTKLELLKESIIHNDLAKFFLTVMWHCKIVDDKKYMRMSRSLVEVGKMFFGWKVFLEKKNPLGQKPFGENA